MLSVVGLDAPTPVCGIALLLNPVRRQHFRVQLDVFPKIEAVGDVIDIGENFGLRRIPLCPFPFLLELLGD